MAEVEAGMEWVRYARGAVDLGCRCPEGSGLDWMTAARQAAELGVAALVFRDHAFCTSATTAFLSVTAFKDAPMSLRGSVALNTTVGGVNPYAVEHALMLGARIISMPTTSASSHMIRNRPAGGMALAPKSLSIYGQRGQVSDSVKEVLDLIARHDAVLCCGYLHVSEILVLLKEAARRGVTRTLVTDPARRARANNADLADVLALGATIEFLPRACEASAERLDIVRRQHPDRLILGLDGGETHGETDLKQRYETALLHWIAAGMSGGELRRGLSDVPGALLGLGRTD